ncbi:MULTISPECIES: CYTH domain-containing protein [Microbacterium]|uniref:CYTH domain-containing protein n=1 Tax=Microbacterium TaxID=33882 RepID=UPI00277D5987|nr:MULTISPECIES: CYTH domain-containing protein [Microbacterium]MDQ1083604.1 inorganic triphosphatase YgiF [Microbacterium sp. SORGH_AS_0344]MDQ1171120.1 inorganic triphosphatase YgiF [Microbacterium proteolyticum]
MSASAHGASSVEVETKFDVDDDTPLPDWSALPGVVRVGEPEPRDLDARYVDTETADLARAGVAVRRRRGGPDEGWHVKGPAQAGGRTERQWPLGDIADDDADPVVPPAVQDAVASIAAAPFVPLARVRNDRTAYALLDADGNEVAEFVDDRVRARDERRGVESSWREWEVELGPAAPADDAGRAAFFAAVEAAVFAAGGRHAASGSKLARTLGH